MTTRLIYIIENFNRNSFCVGRGLAWPTQIWSRSFPPRATAWQISSLRNSNLILVRGDSAAVIHAKCVFSRVCNHNQIRFLAIKHDGVRVWSDCEPCIPLTGLLTHNVAPPPDMRLARVLLLVSGRPRAGLTDWLMAGPAHKSTFSQNCKPNLPNVKFVHRSFLFSLKSYI